jgi:hypothetical protein
VTSVVVLVSVVVALYASDSAVRVIAVKILPQYTAADPEIRARFEREAQSVAALERTVSSRSCP